MIYYKVSGKDKESGNHNTIFVNTDDIKKAISAYIEKCPEYTIEWISREETEVLDV